MLSINFLPKVNCKSVAVSLVILVKNSLLRIVTAVTLITGPLLKLLSDRIIDFFISGGFKPFLVKIPLVKTVQHPFLLVVQQVMSQLMSYQKCQLSLVLVRDF